MSVHVLAVVEETTAPTNSSFSATGEDDSDSGYTNED
jgi:hypothetical protein